MIDLYSGTPGSGKSLHVAQKLYYRLRGQKPCICNFEINSDRVMTRRQRKKKAPYLFRYVPNDKLTPEFLIEFARMYFAGRKVMEDTITLVIDECQLLFNARDWNKPDRKGWLSFFTQHRKYGYHIILVAQFDQMLDKQIRSLVEYEYIHRKMSNFGWRGWILSILFGGNTFVAVKVWYPMNQKVGSDIYHARRKYYRIYDTFLDFESSKSA